MMIKTWGQIFYLGGINENKYFWLANTFSSNLNFITLKIFPIQRWNIKFWEKFQQKFWRETKPLGAYRNMGKFILEVNLTQYRGVFLSLFIILLMLIWVLRNSLERTGNRIRRVWFWSRGLDISCTLWGFHRKCPIF